MFKHPSILNVVEEFLVYYALLNHDNPDNIWESAKLFENGHQMDVIWGLLKPKLPHWVVLHSNSSEERGFLIIWKNKAEFWSRLNLGKSLAVFPLISTPGVY